MAVDWLRKQFRFGGAISVTVNDSATPTTASDEQAASRLVALTGALTAARTFVLPLDAGADWLVRNDTTGGFSVSVGGATGARVDVPPGQLRYLVSDGTKFVRAGEFDPASPGAIGGTAPDAATFSSATALDAYALGDPDGGNGTREGYFTGATSDASFTTIGSIALPAPGWNGIASVESLFQGVRTDDLGFCRVLYRADYEVRSGEFFEYDADKSSNSNNAATTDAVIQSSGSPPNDTLELVVKGIAGQPWNWRATFKVTFNST